MFYYYNDFITPFKWLCPYRKVIFTLFYRRNDLCQNAPMGALVGSKWRCHWLYSTLGKIYMWYRKLDIMRLQDYRKTDSNPRHWLLTWFNFTGLSFHDNLSVIVLYETHILIYYTVTYVLNNGNVDYSKPLEYNSPKHIHFIEQVLCVTFHTVNTKLLTMLVKEAPGGACLLALASSQSNKMLFRLRCAWGP